MHLDPQTRSIAIHRLDGSKIESASDLVAAEEPLEIQVEGQNFAVLMRTPGHDRELVAGFLVTEGLIEKPQDILGIAGNETLSVRLWNAQAFDLAKRARNLFSSSSCGLCSKSSLDAVQTKFPRLVDDFRIAPQILHRLPDTLAAAQTAFKQTGGLHACALFDASGQLLVLREDIGRHNALDKVIGWALWKDRLPLERTIVLLSGRASLEMMQKALAARIPIVAAISAPSSLAVDFARDTGQTLVGFLRGRRMNIYSGMERLQPCGTVGRS